MGDEVIENLDELCTRVIKAKENKEVVSIAYQGNIVDVWERFDKDDIFIDLGSDRLLYITLGQADIILPI